MTRSSTDKKVKIADETGDITITMTLTPAEAQLLSDSVGSIIGRIYHDREGLRSKIRKALRDQGVPCA